MILRLLLCTAIAQTAIQAVGPMMLASASETSSARAEPSVEQLTNATRLIRSGQYDASIAVIEQLLAKYKNIPAAWTIEAIAYSFKGNDTQALSDLKEALKLAPDFPQALQAKAAILSRRRDPAVIPVLKQILKADSQDVTALEMLGSAEAQLSHCANALAAFATAGGDVANHLTSLQDQAACLLETKDLVRAIPVLQQVLVLAPDNGNARYDLAVAQFDGGNTSDASLTLAPLLKQDPDVETLLLAADIFEAQGDTPGAASTLRTAIIADPHRANSYVRFAELCMSHESYEAGVAMVNAGLKAQPEDPTLFLARGLLLGGLGKYDEAEVDFLRAERFDPRHGKGAYAVGVIDLQRNNPDQALREVRKALHQYPRDAELQFLLARALLQKGADSGTPEFHDALRAAEAAVSLNPNLVLARNLLAKIYQESGHLEEAVTQCRAALALEPGDGQASYRLMRSLRALGRTQEADQVGKQGSMVRDRERANQTERLRYKILIGSTSIAAPVTTP